MDAGETDRVVVQDLGSGWVAEMEWPPGVTHGGPSVVVIRPADPATYPPGGVSSTLLRQLDFKAGADTLRRQLAASERWNLVSDQHDEGRDDRIRAALADGVTDEYLARLASRYVSIVNRGQSRPLAVLAEIVGKTESTVKGHLWQARKRGLLVGSAGRAGGKLSDEASRVLRDNLTASSPSVD